MTSALQTAMHGLNAWRMARWRSLLPKIAAFETELQQLADDELRKQSLTLRYRAKSRVPLERLLPEAFALVRETAWRTIGLRHFDVQLLGGIVLCQRAVVEMQTGEGKTLTATLPMYLHALLGKGAHLVTANDYLARRDAEGMRPIYEHLGLTVGIVASQSSDHERRHAYSCDVTYGTSREFGFDFLRDRLKLRRAQELTSEQPQDFSGSTSPATGDRPVQREPYFVLVDEADNLLIDDASTPLVISAPSTQNDSLEAECFHWTASIASQILENSHFKYDHRTRQVELTPLGRQLVRELPKPATLRQMVMPAIYEHAERAIKVDRDFLRERDYVIRDGEVQIVDESTGRIAEGRKWRDGIHQAVEAKESLQVTLGGGQAARVTVQDFFRRYEHLAGMTGTAMTSAREFATIYRLRVVALPTHLPTIRQTWPDRVFGTAEAKWSAIVEEIGAIHATGRPVLVGTRSIDKSLELSRRLQAAGIEHQVLNAYEIDREAEIVAHAGELGKVTVSTNMAGRGTDIKLGPGVAELGGLHVIGTEMHDSARIDRQLIGRCGRQGDPGSYRQFLALGDDILNAGLGTSKAEQLQRSAIGLGNACDRLLGWFHRAQRRVERQKFRQRRILLYLDQERQKVLRQMGQDPYLDTPD